MGDAVQTVAVPSQDSADLHKVSHTMNALSLDTQTQPPPRGAASTGTTKGTRRAGESPNSRSHPRLTYEPGKVLGNGSFGVVCEARCVETGETVAIKKVLQDPRYKNRELDIMKVLRHPNVVELRDFFYTETGDKEGEKFLNVVMEYVPDTVYRMIKTFVRNNQSIPMVLIKVYTYQMCRALGYLHMLGICHRDIKPQNLLINWRTHVLNICDFGSAKRLLPGEHSVAYICSRYYRAPELMLGATEYTTAIDLWSIGCVLGEMILGRPLFAGETSVDQLVKIIQMMGTPTREQMHAMNPNYTEFRFPDVKPRCWNRVFHCQTPVDALDLLYRFLKYEPAERIKPYDVLGHPFFDDLRDPATSMPGGAPLPPLFNFTDEELAQMSPAARAKLQSPA